MNLEELVENEFINFFQYIENKYARVLFNNSTLILCSLTCALSITYTCQEWFNFRDKVIKVFQLFLYWASMFLFLIFIFSFVFFSLFGSPTNSFKDMSSRYLFYFLDKKFYSNYCDCTSSNCSF